MRLAFTYHSLWCSSSNPSQWRALDLYGTCGARSFCPASPQPLPSSLEILRLQWNGWQIRAVWNYELEEESNVDWVWRLLVGSRRNVLWQYIYIHTYPSQTLPYVLLIDWLVLRCLSIFQPFHKNKIIIIIIIIILSMMEGKKEAKRLSFIRVVYNVLLLPFV